MFRNCDNSGSQYEKISQIPSYSAYQIYNVMFQEAFVICRLTMHTEKWQESCVNHLLVQREAVEQEYKQRRRDYPKIPHIRSMLELLLRELAPLKDFFGTKISNGEAFSQESTNKNNQNMLDSTFADFGSFLVEKDQNAVTEDLQIGEQNNMLVQNLKKNLRPKCYKCSMLAVGEGSSVARRSVGAANQPRSVRPHAPSLVVAPLSVNPLPQYVPPPEKVHCVAVSRREFHSPPVQEEVAGNAGNNNVG
ncbi:PREDICTED: uncharacterized protein LOC109244154 [Nicotiana attenuata]|uniref:Uncharacterized protein n=1 Tax=Nicotiana attenuata TaxID=49451 RepID=A0A314L074_NICAT|nr:PREDICTED: uncharacterized protein LOC109244154 [Nicotiana attenuata]OIT34845.1 hypothetical protein A4A49_12171 [Nicotiana attenuata]